MEKREFKAGDKIIITKPNPKNNWSDKMDRYVDRVLTIKATSLKGQHTKFEEFPNGYSDNHSVWSWNATQGHFKHYEEPIKEFPKFQITEYQNINNIQDIKQVINNEGNTFEIGDNVIRLNPTETSKPGKIIRFRHSVNGDNICAVLDNGFQNGIGIDKLQHFVEFKPKEPEFVLPEKWCIKANNKEEAKILFPYFNKSGKCYWLIDTLGHYEWYAVFTNLKYQHSTKHKEDLLEITFEQFEKYVLKKQELPVQNVQELPQKESLLDKAKRLYPPGTTIKSLVTNRIHILDQPIRHTIQRVNPKDDIYSEDGYIKIYDSKVKKWAEIIKD